MKHTTEQETIFDAIERLIRRRWFQVLAGVMAFALAALIVQFNFFVQPDLTAWRFEVEFAADSEVVVLADIGANVSSITGGQNGVTELRIVDEFLFVRSADLGAPTTAEWVRFPLSNLDSRLAALRPPRIVDSLDVDVKLCTEPGFDAEVFVSAFIDLGSSGTDYSVCGIGTPNTHRGTDVRATPDRVPPPSVPGPPDSVIDSTQLDIPAAVTATLEALLLAS